jgi:arginase
MTAGSAAVEILRTPFHLTEPMPSLPHLPGDFTVEPSRTSAFAGGTELENSLAPLCAEVADRVAEGRRRGRRVVVLSGDCATSVGAVAGFQRTAPELRIIWFDAHGDFNTESTSPSGYYAGMSLAKLCGRGALTLPCELGLTPVADEDVMLVGARDIDPGEENSLRDSAIRRLDVEEVAAAVSDLPDPTRPLYLHIDFDVMGGEYVDGLRFPTPAGPRPEAVLEAVNAIANLTAPVVVGLAATWSPDGAGRAHAADMTARFLAALG